MLRTLAAPSAAAAAAWCRRAATTTGLRAWSRPAPVLRGSGVGRACAIPPHALSCAQLSSAADPPGPAGASGATEAGAGEQSYMQIEKDIASMQRAIRDLHGHGEYAESLEVAQRALEVSRAHFGAEHPVTASLLNNAALNNKYLGNLDEAVRDFSAALEIYEAVLGESHTSCATCKLNIAKLLQLQANHVPGLDRMQLLQEAKELAEQALVSKLDNLGERNPEVGTVMFSLGAIYNDLKMHGEAVETLVEAMALLEDRLGPRHPSVATARNNLGFTYKQMGRLEDALTEYEAALSIRREAFGDPGHPHVIASQQNLAELLRAMGREDRALELQQDIIATIELRNQRVAEQEEARGEAGAGGATGVEEVGGGVEAPPPPHPLKSKSVRRPGLAKDGGIVRPVDGFFDPDREGSAN